MPSDGPQTTNPIDEAERVIRAQSGVLGLRIVAAFFHALPTDVVLTWHDETWVPVNMLAMELEERANAR